MVPQRPHPAQPSQEALPAALIRIHWHHPHPWREGSSRWTEPPEHLPGAARLTWTRCRGQTWLVQAGSVLAEGGMATPALWHCRSTDTVLGNATDQSGWFMLNRVWRNKCMYQIKPHLSLFPPSFYSKVLEGFPAIDKIIFTKLKCKICSRAC